MSMNQEIELYDMPWLFFTTYLGFSIRFMQVAHDPFYLFIYIGYVSRVIKLYEMSCIKVMSTIFMHLEMQVNQPWMFIYYFLMQYNCTSIEVKFELQKQNVDVDSISH